MNFTIDRAVDHAVVLGGGVAGLLAARVLAEAYASVTVVERDALDTSVRHRRGVPQARHAHLLLARGRQIVEDLLPGITAQLVAEGAPIGDALADTRMLMSGHWLRRRQIGLPIVATSRPFLEHHIRLRVRSLSTVRVVDRCDAAGLRLTSDMRRVNGVHLLRRAPGSAAELVPADLVVDATGRGSRAAAWLASVGLARPAEQRVPINLGYASRRYRSNGDTLAGDLGVLHGLTPTRPRGGGLARLENGHLLLTLAGIGDDHPPVDPPGFTAFARSLSHSDIYDAIRDAEPVDDPVAYRFSANVRRRYDRVPTLPAGLVVLGDSLCSMNPIYGQGMTVAAVQALTLRRHLRRGLPRPRPLHRDLIRDTGQAWTMATGADLMFDSVNGRRNAGTAVMGAYITRLHQVASSDPAVAVAFARTAALVDPPSALLRPSVAVRVLRGQRPGTRPAT